jgi:hypothetical protein
LDTNGYVSAQTLIANGNVSATNVSSSSGGTFGTIRVEAGSIVDSTGAISFGSNALSAQKVTTGDLVMQSNSITSTNNALGFGDTNLDTNGYVSAQTLIANGNVSATNVSSSSGGTFGTIRVEAGSIVDTLGSISFSSNALTTSGDISAAAFLSSSDARLKENVTLIDQPLEKLRELRGVTFDWISSKKADVGVIAQDVESILPELVHFDNSGFRRVDYPKLVALLIEAVKHLDSRVQQLEGRIQ